jgi:hypothetical protein
MGCQFSWLVGFVIECPRRFEPDRLPPHMRGCKGAPQHKRARSQPVFHTQAAAAAAAAKNTVESPVRPIPRLDLSQLAKLDQQINGANRVQQQSGSGGTSPDGVLSPVREGMTPAASRTGRSYAPTPGSEQRVCISALSLVTEQLWWSVSLISTAIRAKSDAAFGIIDS